MIGNGSNQHSHFSSTRSSVMPDRSALHRLQWNTRRFRIRFMSAPPASRVSLYSRSSHQCTCHLCHAVCCVGVTHFGFAVAARSSTSAEGQPSQTSFCSSHIRLQRHSSQQHSSSSCMMCVVCCPSGPRRGYTNLIENSTPGLRGHRQTETGLRGRRYYRIYR